jgi:hypothetical protein
VEDDLCYLPLCREVSCEHGSIEYLGEIFEANGSKFLKDLACDEVVAWQTSRFEVLDDSLNF